MTTENDRHLASPAVDPRSTQTPLPPSISTLVKTTAISLALAGILLVTIILPAEYNLDPLGTGRLLGLTEIASPTVEAVELPTPTSAELAPLQSGPLGQYSSEFKLDVFEITLQPYEYVEYKYHLEQNATMLYSWTASAALIQDFHGERTSPGEGKEEPSEEQSYDKQNRQQANGSFAAPFTGIHGWYWENPGSEPITLRLTSSGFYTAALEIRSDRTRNNRDLRPLAALTPSPDRAEEATR
jgi:hypothetical protein